MTFAASGDDSPHSLPYTKPMARSPDNHYTNRIYPITFPLPTASSLFSSLQLASLPLPSEAIDSNLDSLPLSSPGMDYGQAPPPAQPQVTYQQPLATAPPMEPPPAYG